MNNIIIFNKIVLALMIMIIILISIAVGTLITESGTRFLDLFKNNLNSGGFSATRMLIWGMLLVIFFVMIYIMLHTKSTVFVRPSANRTSDV